MKNQLKFKLMTIIMGSIIASNLFAQNVDFKLLKSGQNCNHTIAENFLIDNKNDLTKLGIELSDSINFDKELVLVVYRGGCPSGGYSVYIKEIQKNKVGLFVEIVYADPGENCRRSLALTQPYAVYSIKKQDIKITFNTSTMIKDCEK